MARALWSGSISFGLVNVPVKAFTAVRDHEVHFHQLEKGTGARIHHQNVSEKTGKPVDTDDIELGYEIRSGRYVTFEREELEDLRPKSTRAIEVADFVALDEIDPIYYERTYWLGPDGDAAEQAYRLLLAAMEERGRVGIGTVVMRNKQYLAAVRPLDGVLAMSTMRFADEVVAQADVEELPSKRSKPDAKAVKLAIQIVDSLATEWDPERYHDTFTEQLRDIIDRKDKGEEAVVEEAPAQTAQVIDLMAALEASVAATRSSRRERRTDALAQAAERLVAEQDPEDAGDDVPAEQTAAKRAPAKKAAAKKAPAKKAAAKKRASRRRSA
jgi:DNA end-binding protein Ku